MGGKGRTTKASSVKNSGGERGKDVCLRGFPTVSYGIDVAVRAGGVVVRGQLHGAEDLGGGVKE